MIKQDTGFNNHQATGKHSCQVFDCRLISRPVPNGGTGIHAIDSAEKGMGGGAVVTGLIENLDRSVVFQADSGPGAFVNSYNLRVKIASYLTGIEHIPGTGETNGHYLIVDTQPVNNESYQSKWLWKLRGSSHMNTLVGQL